MREGAGKVAAGGAMLVAGVAGEITTFVSGGWPTAFPWVLMLGGLMLAAYGLTQMGSRLARWAWGALAALALTVVILWLTG